MKIITVLGARPQFVKAAVVSRSIEREGIEEKIIHTGQHFDYNMSQVFFDEMEISRPHYNLEINGLGHGAMTGRMLEQVEGIIISERPDFVLVYGDTNSTLAGALAASKLNIPVAHVEAGLRSFEMRMPEEVNRIVTDRLSKLLFCPTQTAVQNLKTEGYDNFENEIICCGDVMYDAVLFYKEKIKEKSTILNIKNLPHDFILTTIHRAENTDDPQRLKRICESLNQIHTDIEVIMPLHPRTKALINSQNIKLNVNVIEPVGYFDMLALIEKCKMVMTDSGGLQKEAFFFEKYCITLRDQTEWIELVDSDVNFLVGSDMSKILNAFNENKSKKFTALESLYGNGNASQLIASKLKEFS
ncbi:MAG TPA: UDP-N-acetylglucosamine 2-epimerase (non-hydrolyzing) [Cyclobacteriaceae bacterium]|jgi:UDP-GlcNAc3NAcA epimerase|nr:UDP-N-acetylglucosamine 2-epimerase (non-hydrolyzing) [Cyclobacteriaceae bacterium]